MKSVSANTSDQILRMLRVVVVGIGLMLLAAILGGYAGAAGHTEVPLTYFFPYWMIALGALNLETIGNILFAIQFPVYVLIVDRVKSSHRKFLAILILIALHIVAVILALRVWRHG